MYARSNSNQVPKLYCEQKLKEVKVLVIMNVVKPPFSFVVDVLTVSSSTVFNGTSQ